MPHRKSPTSYALNLIRKSALFDVKTREQLNRIDETEFRTSFEAQFPEVDVDMVLQNLSPSALVDGLVLQDPRGDGVLQASGKPYPVPTIESERKQMRLTAYQKNGAL